MVQADKQLLPVIVWGFLQLAILGIGASGFPLWAHHPFPRESLALQEMLVGQTILFALLFPVLVTRPSDLVIAIVLMMPIDELAGQMSSASQTSIWLGFGCVAVWLAGLGGLRRTVRNPTGQITIERLAIVLTIGGVILDYLRWEASASIGQSSAFMPISMLPLLCRLIETPSAAPWIQAFSPAVGAIALVTIQFITKRRNRPSTSLHIQS